MYPTLFGKAAALLFSICQNHALLDGNKRLAWAAAVTFLAFNDVPIPDVDVDAAETFMFAVAKGELAEVTHIEARLLALYGRQPDCRCLHLMNHRSVSHRGSKLSGPKVAESEPHTRWPEAE